ncbi:hypothetical protein [Rhodococcus sp. MTM3W5.2]|uniref:hypothetical protein n=1 Tax=Rhodococcus sp. MTM3W5.2 TaxID=1805827 RepID=UPI001CB8BB99|nr:hypothetical protein [Rhodococcus sp. MTM3W5.2]
MSTLRRPAQTERLAGLGRWGFRNWAATATASGMVGCNVNVANVIGGIFAATGQDTACVHESSLGQLQNEPEPDATRPAVRGHR